VFIVISLSHGNETKARDEILVRESPRGKACIGTEYTVQLYWIVLRIRIFKYYSHDLSSGRRKEISFCAREPSSYSHPSIVLFTFEYRCRETDASTIALEYICACTVPTDKRTLANAMSGSKGHRVLSSTPLLTFDCVTNTKNKEIHPRWIRFPGQWFPFDTLVYHWPLTL